MRRNVVRLGDPTTHGGSGTTTSSSSIVDGKPVALIGDLVSCPKEGHGVNKIVEGSQSCYSDGRSVVTDASLCECGCQVISTIRTAEME